MASTSKSPATRRKPKARSLAFPVEFRLRIVKLFLEEGYSARLPVEQFGISTHSVQRWVRAYRVHGEAGLAPRVPAGRVGRVPEEVRQQAGQRCSSSGLWECRLPARARCHGARGPRRSYTRSPGRDPSCQLAAVEPGLGDGRL